MPLTAPRSVTCVDNVAFTELHFMNYKMGEVNQQKLPFTFRPSDLVCLDSIQAAD